MFDLVKESIEAVMVASSKFTAPRRPSCMVDAAASSMSPPAKNAPITPAPTMMGMIGSADASWGFASWPTTMMPAMAAARMAHEAA